MVTKANDDDGACTPEDCALREAVLAANALPGSDRVEIPSGTYQLSLTGPVPENSGLTGDLDILDALELEGVGGMATIVGDGTDRVLDFIGLHEFDVANVVATGGVTTNSGGGIRANGVFTLRNSIVRENESSGDAGGVFLVLDGGASIVGTTIADNAAPSGRGGGLLVELFSLAGRQLTLTNVTVSGNHALTGGGAYLSGGGSAEIINSTFADNSGDEPFSDALVVDGTSMAIQNTLFANNTCGYIAAVPMSNGHNMEGPTATCFVPGEDTMGVPDIMLGPLTDNGGPTPTHALLPGSPAIDAALDADCPATDQRGITRPQDGDASGSAVCDIGAFELLGPTSILEIPTLGEVGRLAFALLAALAGILLLRQRYGW